MSLSKFLLAFAAGGLLCYWLLFLYIILAATGVILWDGRDNEGVNWLYLMSLYGSPVLVALLSYWALRPRNRDLDRA
jgi:hypothetical protein